MDQDPKNGQAQQPKVAAQLVITLYEDGNIQLQGPVDNDMIFFGIIGCAKKAREKWLDMVQKQRGGAMQRVIPVKEVSAVDKAVHTAMGQFSKKVS